MMNEAGLPYLNPEMMRDEQEMLGLILGMAREDERIRAVILNGSRVNPSAPVDIFQDYDVVFIVSEVAGFVEDRAWIAGRFGDVLIMQTPDESDGLYPDKQASFSFLMLFMDGNRIDLTFYPVEKLSEMRHGSLSAILLDKDGILPQLPLPSLDDYKTLPPTAEQFAHCCNEFWWVSTYVAKGLWRKELSYAHYMFERPVRDMLLRMLEWHIGLESNFTAYPGKLGKYLERHLEPEQWQAFASTYAAADYEQIWEALFVMGQLFRGTATGVAGRYGYSYPYEDDLKVTDYLKRVRSLARTT